MGHRIEASALPEDEAAMVALPAASTDVVVAAMDLLVGSMGEAEAGMVHHLLA